VRHRQSRERVGVSRRGRVGRVRREGSNLDYKRLPARLLDELRCQSGKDVGQVVCRLESVCHDLSILVESVVKLGIPISSYLPGDPAGSSGVALRQIAIEILAHHRRAIAGGPKRRGKGVPLATKAHKREIAPVFSLVLEDARVVGKTSGEDRRARRAAQGIGHKVVGEGDAFSLHPQNVRHELQQIHGEIVSQHKDDVGMLR